MERIENRVFDEINIGDRAQTTRTLTQRDIELFALVSGDMNPMHLDEAFAQNTMFHQIIAPGMWSGALISAVIGTQLPGPGTIYLNQSLRFRRPIFLRDTVTVALAVTAKNGEKRRVTLDCTATNQHGEVVTLGVAEVIAPHEKFRAPESKRPESLVR